MGPAFTAYLPVVVSTLEQASGVTAPKVHVYVYYIYLFNDIAEMICATCKLIRTCGHC